MKRSNAYDVLPIEDSPAKNETMTMTADNPEDVQNIEDNPTVQNIEEIRRKARELEDEYRERSLMLRAQVDSIAAWRFARQQQLCKQHA